MAATASKLNSTLVVKYKDGVDKKGKEIIKKQRFAKVKPAATEQAVYDTALEIEKLLGRKLDEVIREDQSGITNA